MRLGVAATAPVGRRPAGAAGAHARASRSCSRVPTGRAAAAGGSAPPPAKEVAERLGIPVLQPERLGAETRAATRTRSSSPPTACSSPRRCSSARSGSTSIRRCCRAGAARRRSSGRSWPVTARPASRSTRPSKELDAGPIAAQRAFPIGPEDDAGAVFARAAAARRRAARRRAARARRFTPQPEEGVTYAAKIGAGGSRARLEPAGAGEPRPHPCALAAHRRARRAARPAA